MYNDGQSKREEKKQENVPLRWISYCSGVVRRSDQYHAVTNDHEKAQWNSSEFFPPRRTDRGVENRSCPGRCYQGNRWSKRHATRLTEDGSSISRSATLRADVFRDYVWSRIAHREVSYVKQPCESVSRRTLSGFTSGGRQCV